MTYRPKHRKPGMARRITRRMAALAAVTGALAVTMPGAAASAGTAPRAGEQAFCLTFEHFGEHPDFMGLDRARETARRADPATRALYYRFQWLLLGGRSPVALERVDLDIYDSCARGGVTFGSKGN